VKKWQNAVEKALRAGESPVTPFLNQENPNLDALPVILAKLDYQAIYQRVKEQKGEIERLVDRTWQQKKAEAPPRVRVLMAALDNLEQQFRARKKLVEIQMSDNPYDEDYGDRVVRLHWLLSDAVMQLLAQPSSEDADANSVRQLISARYLVPLEVGRPWDLTWDED